MRFRVAKDGSVSSPAHTLEVIGRSLRAPFQQPLHRAMAEYGAFALVFYIAYRSGMSFSQTTASPFWFPDSVLLSALLVARPGRWWVFILLPLPIRLLSEVSEGIPLWFLLTTFWIDSAKGLAAALALRGLVARSFRLQTPREIGAFFLFAVILVPGAAAFLGSGARSVLGHDYWPSWEQWFLGNAMAQMVVTPLMLHWCLVPPKVRAAPARNVAEAAVLTFALVVTSYLATNTGPSSIDFAGARFYLPVPFMFWAAFRFGMRGVSGSVGIAAILAVHGALHGRGPFADLPPTDITLALQNFLLLRAAPLFLVAAAIAQKRDVEARLLESEDRFRNVANEAPVLLWVSRFDNHCEFLSQGWLDFTGRTLDEVVGQGWMQDVHPDDVAHMWEAIQGARREHRSFEVEYRLRRHDGEYRWVLDKGVTRRAANGELLGYVGSVTDITDRKRAEENARHLSHAQRLVMMGELSATIAHEVRQPLSAILSNADAAAALLQSPSPPLDEIRDIISDIRQDDLRANEIVGRIRDFLRTQTPRTQPVDINALVADALHFITVDARRRRIQVRTELADGLPAVSADRTQLLQVLINLLVNGMDAMDGTPDAARILTVRTRAGDSGGAEVAVIDQGHGIAPDELHRMFEPFFSTKSTGMGLGLSIARSIMMAHQGRIGAENNADGGATLRIFLPAAPPRLW